VSAADQKPRRQEVLVSPRVYAPVAPGRRLRSATVLLVLSALLGVALAAALATGIGFIVEALLHAVGTNS